MKFGATNKISFSFAFNGDTGKDEKVPLTNIIPNLFKELKLHCSDNRD